MKRNGGKPSETTATATTKAVKCFPGRSVGGAGVDPMIMVTRIGTGSERTGAKEDWEVQVKTAWFGKNKQIERPEEAVLKGKWKVLFLLRMMMMM